MFEGFSGLSNAGRSSSTSGSGSGRDENGFAIIRFIAILIAIC